MPIDTELLLDAVNRFIEREGREVLSLGWDGGAPGMSGCAWVREWHGLYLVESSDVDEDGPFESLEEALAGEMFTVVTAQPELSSRVLKMPRLKEIALGLVRDGDRVAINGKEFVRRGDTLVKAR